MKRAVTGLLAAVVLVVAGCGTVAPEGWSSLGGLLGGEPSEQTVIAGLKEALRVGTERAAGALSKEGGYSGSPVLKLLVPQQLDKAASTLRRLGFGHYVNQFEGKMNEAAEKAAAQALPVFAEAIKEMSFADAKAILQGGDTAATDYFRAKTGDRLRTLYAPIVRQTMDEVGAAKAYNTLIDTYTAVPLANKPDFSLDTYVAQKALDGLFLQLGEMERGIRTDPAARTTELLRQVFGRN